MNINKRKLKIKHFNKNTYLKKNKKTNWIIKFLIYTIVFFIFFSFVLWIILYKKYIQELPSINELENLEIAESTTIYDREWWELYKIFKEKRTYIPFEEINKNMINAIIAWEDKRYWENPWVDIIWIIRAVIYKVIWKTDKLEATSTITQQLIRNTILSNERKIERKIKEIYLSYKLSAWVSKEKIIELYLNKISFWHNAFWIEQAAKTFFGVNAKDLWIMESSILASLPKWPSYYSPYNHTDRTVGYPYLYQKDDIENITSIITPKDKETNIEKYNIFVDFLNSLKNSRLEWTNKTLICGLKKENFKIDLRIDNDWCSILEYSKLLNFLNWIRLENENAYIEYQTWRKDFILGRMLEDKYINFDEYRNAIINAIWYNFTLAKEKIKAPHFVFYVKEYLENKYWKDIIESWGLKVYTTLDPKLQTKAEEIVEKYTTINKENFWANNAALISLDNKNWEILSMVWGNDYFDIENKWNVNIVTSTLQPWSSFKPFVYSMWIYNNEIWSKSPIFDLETEFPSYTPANFDWEFMWKMNISTALNNSRNIPAIKMFYMAGGEKNIVEFMKLLWVKSLKNHNQYWAPLALWTWEMTPLELAWAYSVFANLWVKKELSVILKIVDSKWIIVEEKKDEDWEYIISKDQSYIINTILSDSTTRPEFWNNYLTIPWRSLATKTWTSTKQYMRNNEKIIFPSNLWTIWYTPQITTVAWAWNTDWTELNFKWNWLEAAWPIMRDFMTFAHEWKEKETWSKTSWVKEINISSVSWLLPNPETEDSNFLTKSLFINPPTKYDNSFKKIKIDILCNWIISDKTPEAAIKEVILLELHSLSPTNPNWENPVTLWSTTDEFIELYWNYPNIVTSISDEICERSIESSEITIKSTIEDEEIFTPWENYIEFAYRSNNQIIKLDILINDILADEIILKNKLEWAYIWTFNIPSEFVWKKVKLELRAVDSEYYSHSEEKNIYIVAKDITAPEIILKNPIDWNIKIYNDEFFNLKAEVKDRSSIRTINIRINWKTLKSWITNRNIIFPINEERDLPIWNHIIQIEVIDKAFNNSKKDINLEIMQR